MVHGHVRGTIQPHAGAIRCEQFSIAVEIQEEMLSGQTAQSRIISAADLEPMELLLDYENLLYLMNPEAVYKILGFMFCSHALHGVCCRCDIHRLVDMNELLNVRGPDQLGITQAEK